MSTSQFLTKPDIKISVKQTFGFDSEMSTHATKEKHVKTAVISVQWYLSSKCLHQYYYDLLNMKCL